MTEIKPVFYRIPYSKLHGLIKIIENETCFYINNYVVNKKDLLEKYPEAKSDFWFADKSSDIARFLSFLSDIYNIWKNSQPVNETDLRLFKVAGDLVSKLNVPSFSYNEEFKHSLKLIIKT